MVNCSSVDSLSKSILTLTAALSDPSMQGFALQAAKKGVAQGRKPVLILVGGCSRAGKTVLVSKLMENIAFSGINTAVVSLDAWLVSVNKRKQDSSVLERYEIAAIVSSVEKILQGVPVYPPVYDIASRSRLERSESAPIFINEGVLFIDGVIALAIKEFIESAALRIFVDIPDQLRRQRLVDFYSDTKKLGRRDCENIIEAREKEEVPFIKKTAINADVIFDSLKLK